MRRSCEAIVSETCSPTHSLFPLTLQPGLMMIELGRKRHFQHIHTNTHTQAQAQPNNRLLRLITTKVFNTHPPMASGVIKAVWGRFWCVCVCVCVLWRDKSSGVMLACVCARVWVKSSPDDGHGERLPVKLPETNRDWCGCAGLPYISLSRFVCVCVCVHWRTSQHDAIMLVHFSERCVSIRHPVTTECINNSYIRW